MAGEIGKAGRAQIGLPKKAELASWPEPIRLRLSGAGLGTGRNQEPVSLYSSHPRFGRPGEPGLLAAATAAKPATADGVGRGYPIGFF